MADVRGNGETLKKSHFARLHERIQNKYEEMQRKLEKSKSVDSLSSLKEDYMYKEPRCASSADINRIDMNNEPLEKNSVKYRIIEEEIHKNDASFQYVTVRESSISESDITPSPFEAKEQDNDSDTNRFFGDDFYRLSLES